MKTHVFRLRPGQNFREEIDKYVSEHNIRAGIILTCVGNLTKAILRMANAKVIKTWEGSFEIISVVGTVEAGNSHIHVCLSDEAGNTFGGHLKDGFHAPSISRWAKLRTHARTLEPSAAWSNFTAKPPPPA